MEAEPKRQDNPFLKKEEETDSKKGEETVSDLIDKLISASNNEKVTILIRSFESEWKTFKEKLGEQATRTALQEFLQERLQGKLVAARAIANDKKD